MRPHSPPPRTLISPFSAGFHMIRFLRNKKTHNEAELHLYLGRAELLASCAAVSLMVKERLVGPDETALRDHRTRLTGLVDALVARTLSAVARNPRVAAWMDALPEQWAAHVPSFADTFRLFLDERSDRRLTEAHLSERLGAAQARLLAEKEARQAAESRTATMENHLAAADWETTAVTTSLNAAEEKIERLEGDVAELKRILAVKEAEEEEARALKERQQAQERQAHEAVVRCSLPRACLTFALQELLRREFFNSPIQQLSFQIAYTPEIAADWPLLQKKTAESWQMVARALFEWRALGDWVRHFEECARAQVAGASFIPSSPFARVLLTIRGPLSDASIRLLSASLSAALSSMVETIVVVEVRKGSLILVLNVPAASTSFLAAALPLFDPSVRFLDTLSTGEAAPEVENAHSSQPVSSSKFRSPQKVPFSEVNAQ